MNDLKVYVLGQNERAARRLEIQDKHFGEASENLLDDLAIQPTDRVVELGCGAGSLTRRVLARLGAGGVVVAVDTTSGLLDQATAALSGKGPGRFEPVSADVTSLGTWLDGANVVLGRAVLHHIPMAELFVGRLRARLRPGTRVGFIEPDFRSPLDGLPTWKRPDTRNSRASSVGTMMNQLYLSRRISPAVGAPWDERWKPRDFGACDQVVWSATDAPVIENMVIFTTRCATRYNRSAFRPLPKSMSRCDCSRSFPEKLPAVWGAFRVVGESSGEMRVTRAPKSRMRVSKRSRSSLNRSGKCSLGRPSHIARIGPIPIDEHESRAMAELVARINVRPVFRSTGCELLAHELVDRLLVPGEKEPAFRVGIAVLCVFAKKAVRVVAFGSTVNVTNFTRGRLFSSA